MNERIVENSARMTLLQVCGIIANTVLYFALARILGSSDYGIASCTVIPALTLLRTGVFGALMFGTAKVIAANPQAMPSCISVSRKAYAIVGGAFVIVFLAFADIIAGLLRDPSLTPFFRLMAVAVPPAAVFVLFHATLVGLKDFRSVLRLGMLFQVLKLVLTIAFVLVGTKVYGLVFGFAAASVISLLAFRRKARPVAGSKTITLSYFFTTIGGIFVAFAVAITQRYVCLWNLKRIVFDNQTVAYYSVANQLASVPALIFTGVMVALWPAISSLADGQNLSLARDHIGKSLKYTMIGLLPIAALLAALPNYAIRLAFGAEYAQGATVLPFLVIGFALLALQSVVMSALLALGKVKTIVCITGGATIVAFFLGNVLIPKYGIMGAAASEVVGFLLSSMIVAIVSRRTFGKLISSVESGKIAASAAVLFLVVRSFAFLGYWVAAVIVVASCLYLLTLIMLGVLSTGEIKMALSRLRRRA